MASPGKRLQDWQSSSEDARPETEQLALVYRKGLLVTTMIWGWKRPWSSRSIINCRMEKAVPSGLWHESLGERRCLLPVSAWWEKERSKKRTWWKFKTPENPFFLAGLFELENNLPRFSLLTRPAEESVLPVHPRMPVPFSQAEGLRWIRPELTPEKALAMAAESAVKLRKEGFSPHLRGTSEGPQKLLFLPSQEQEKGHTS